MKINKSLEYAEQFLELLSPACDRIEIVGSNKRQDKTDVHDIEILLIAKNERPVPEFGKPNQVYKNKLEKVIADLHYQDILRHAADKKDGDKLKKRAIVGVGELNEFCLELYIVQPETWGIQNVIRTGPSIFSHCFVTNKSKGAYSREENTWYAGLLPDQYTYVRGETKILFEGNQFSLPEEKDAIEILGFGWVEPRDRIKLVKLLKAPPLKDRY